MSYEFRVAILMQGTDELITDLFDNYFTNTKVSIRKNPNEKLLINKLMPLSENATAEDKLNMWGQCDELVIEGFGYRSCNRNNAWFIYYSPIKPNPRFLYKLSELYPGIKFSISIEEDSFGIYKYQTIINGKLITDELLSEYEYKRYVSRIDKWNVAQELLNTFSDYKEYKTSLIELKHNDAKYLNDVVNRYINKQQWKFKSKFR